MYVGVRGALVVSLYSLFPAFFVYGTQPDAAAAGSQNTLRHGPQERTMGRITSSLAGGINSDSVSRGQVPDGPRGGGIFEREGSDRRDVKPDKSRDKGIQAREIRDATPEIHRQGTRATETVVCLIREDGYTSEVSSARNSEKPVRTS
ncbi:hypothetical protein B0H14DRAFT_2607946 [Mycena olivaceomarginata]|nr:hypothetical protein B0H14DRAFT_2607946 [Mycena olivaceomarginata]